MSHSFQGDRVTYLLPLGNSVDDSSRISSAINAQAAMGGTVYLDGRNGAFTTTSQITITSPVGVNIIGINGAEITGSSVSGAILLADGWNAGFVDGAVTTLAANATVGVRYLPLAALGTIAVGSEIFLYSATKGLAAYTVKRVSAAWAINTAYVVGQLVTNDGGKVYTCITAGTSAGAGGPTGVGADITDNTAHWKYIGAGAGIQVDRPILKAFLSGDSLYKSHGFPKKIKISNIKFSGTANYAIQMIGGETDCSVNDCEISGTWSNWAANFDYGGIRCEFNRINGFNSSTSWWLGIESGESCRINECVGFGPASNGLFLNSCVDTRVVKSKYSGGTGGCYFGGESATDVTSCFDCSVTDCDFSDNVNFGLAIVDGSKFIQVENVTALRNAIGISLTSGATSTPPNSISIDGADVRNCTTSGINIGGGNNIHLTDILAHNCVIAVQSGASYAQDGLIINGLMADDCTGTAINIQNGVATTNTKIVNSIIKRANSGLVLASGVQDTTFDNCLFEDNAITVSGGSAMVVYGRVRFQDTTIYWTTNPGVNNYGIVVGASADVLLDGTNFYMPKTNIALFIAILAQGASSIVRVSNSRIIDGAGGAVGGTRYFYYASAANFYFLGENVDSSVAETPYSLSGGATKNFGTFALNGATAVDVTWAKIHANSQVRYFFKTLGGTQGPDPSFVITNGTKVAFTGTAGDTSTYTYQIDGA